MSKLTIAGIVTGSIVALAASFGIGFKVGKASGVAQATENKQAAAA